MYFIMARSFWF